MSSTPSIISQCAGCGIGTLTLGEWYMVEDRIWQQAWAGRRKSVHGKVPERKFRASAVWSNASAAP